jgi:crotonobetainyl-CoA:carnitine CoA-transferase CaiB-like acyl-CoA transferase
MRRADLADDPRFATAAARRANFAELHRIGQNWILTFADVGALDAQLDEAKIAFGEVRSLKQLSEMEWAGYWGAVREVSDRNGGRYRLPGRPWRFSGEQLAPLGEPAFQGEDNRAVFTELGLSDEQIDGCVASGALVTVSIPEPQTRGTRYDPFPMMSSMASPMWRVFSTTSHPWRKGR